MTPYEYTRPVHTLSPVPLLDNTERSRVGCWRSPSSLTSAEPFLSTLARLHERCASLRSLRRRRRDLPAPEPTVGHVRRLTARQSCALLARRSCGHIRRRACRASWLPLLAAADQALQRGAVDRSACLASHRRCDCFTCCPLAAVRLLFLLALWPVWRRKVCARFFSCTGKSSWSRLSPT